MIVFRALFHKELAEASLLLVAGALLAALARLAAPLSPWRLAAVAGPAVLLGTALLARDARGGGIRMMRRSPAGPWPALGAKLLVLAIAVALFACGAGVLSQPLVVAAALALGIWSLGVVAWLPQSSVVLPLAFLTLLPPFGVWLVAYVQNRWVRPDGAERVLLVAGVFPLSATALAVSGWCALRLADGTLRAALRGIAILAVVSGAFTLWTRTRAPSWDHYRPDETHAALTKAWLSPNERFVYVLGENQEANDRNYAFVIDLERRTVEHLPERLSVWGGPSHGYASGGDLIGSGSSIVRRLRFDEEPYGTDYVDADRNVVIHRHVSGEELPGDLVTELHASARRSTRRRLADGAPVWRFGNQWYVDSATSPRRLVERKVAAKRLFDFERNKLWQATELPEHIRRVRPGYFLGIADHWFRYAPETKQRLPLQSLRRGTDQLGPEIGDGRLFVYRHARRSSGILDPHADTMTWPSFADPSIVSAIVRSEGRLPARDRSGRPVFTAHVRRRSAIASCAVLRLAGDRIESVDIDARRGHVVGPFGEDGVLVLCARRLLHASFKTGKAEQVWPFRRMEALQ